MKKARLLVISLFLTFIAASVGSVFTFKSISTWYITLNKPFFNPPNWIFSPVWTALYILMGLSLYLVWISKKSLIQKKGMNYFFIQLALNTLWSILFFGLQNPLIAFLEIVVLWYFIYLTIKYFSKVNKTSAYLLYPYLAWVSFASLLNLSIVILN